MKKIAFLLIIILLLSGCKKENQFEKFYLEDKYYNNSGINDIDGSELVELENSEESFGVFIYLSSCSSCSIFNSVLEDFTEKYNISFYATSVSEINDSACSCVKYSPSVALYKKGKLIAYLDANSDDDLPYYKSTDGFKSWFEKFVYLEK